MKAQILNHTGLTEEQFYKKYKTQADFDKSASGKSFKAKYGSTLKKAANGDTNFNGIPDYLEGGNNLQYGVNNLGGTQENQQWTGNKFGNTPLWGGPNNNVANNYAQQTAASNFQPITNEKPAGIAAEAKKAANENAVKPKEKTSTGMTLVDSAMAVVDGMKALKAEKKAKKMARVWNDVSKVSRKAFDTVDIDKDRMVADNLQRQRKAFMPTITGEELFPVNGVGTNSLGQAEDGMTLHKANHGEIMNTYAPGTIYDNLEYEPLAESTYNPIPEEGSIKSYRSGGTLPKAMMGMGGGGMSGMSSMMGGMGGKGGGMNWGSAANAGTGVASNAFDNNAGSQIGGGLGKAVGSIWGPIGEAVGELAGTVIGGAVDQNPKQIKKANKSMMANVNYMSNMGAVKNNFASKYSSFGENGLTMESFRTGGNIRQNSVGDIQALSGGHLEPMGYNPYSDGTGVTSMIKGQSHDESNGRHTGVLLNYDKRQDGGEVEPQVEAENNEPITEIGDNAVIFGDMVINDRTTGGDPLFTGLYGKTFKKAMAGIAEQNLKLNKQQAKNTKALNELEAKTPIDRLTLNSLSVTEKAINEKYALNDAIMKKAAAHQDVVNTEAERLGIDSGAFSRGKLKLADKGTAKNGAWMTAAEGKTVTLETTGIPIEKVKKTKALPEYPKGQHPTRKFYGKVTDQDFEVLKEENPWYDWDTFDPTNKEDVSNFQSSFNRLARKTGSPERLNVDGQLGEQTASARIEQTDLTAKGPVEDAAATPAATTPEKDKVYDITPYKKSGWETLAGQIMPWIRKQPWEDLQGNQLAGEMFALSHNQEEPVQARYYHPQLRTPYDVSFQDQLNENQADFNQLARSNEGNPQAQAMLAAQKYGANSKVLGEQFRQNQAMKENVYSGNIATLNDAQLKNLQIADQQYVRQATAKSNTKMVKQEALNSIASKIGQNRLENRTLQTYANMFPDFSYDKNFRIRKTGAPVDWQIDQSIYSKKDDESTHVPIFNSAGKITGYRQVDPNAKLSENDVASSVPETVPLTTAVTPKGNTTKTMGTATATGPTLPSDKNKKRYGGIVKAFKDL